MADTDDVPTGFELKALSLETRNLAATESHLDRDSVSEGKSRATFKDDAENELHDPLSVKDVLEILKSLENNFGECREAQLILHKEDVSKTVIDEVSQLEDREFEVQAHELEDLYVLKKNYRKSAAPDGEDRDSNGDTLRTLNFKSSESHLIQVEECLDPDRGEKLALDIRIRCERSDQTGVCRLYVEKWLFRVHNAPASFASGKSSGWFVDSMRLDIRGRAGLRCVDKHPIKQGYKMDHTKRQREKSGMVGAGPASGGSLGASIGSGKHSVKKDVPEHGFFGCVSKHGEKGAAFAWKLLSWGNQEYDSTKVGFLEAFFREPRRPATYEDESEKDHMWAEWSFDKKKRARVARFRMDLIISLRRIEKRPLSSLFPKCAGGQHGKKKAGVDLLRGVRRNCTLEIH